MGSRLEKDDHNIIGVNGMNNENARGQWQKQWATKERLTIANTFFSKPVDKKTTHTGTSGRPMQIDFVLVDSRLRLLVNNVGSVDKPDVGSDHKAVQLQATITLTDR